MDLSGRSAANAAGDGVLGAGVDKLASGKGGSGLINRRTGLARDTVVLRDQGFLGDPESDVWGEVAGAVEEQMLLAEGNRVYLLLKAGKRVRPGEELTVFRSVRQPDHVPGARSRRRVVAGARYRQDPERGREDDRVARATITESLDVIERGAKIGPVGAASPWCHAEEQKTVVARVLTSLYPWFISVKPGSVPRSRQRGRAQARQSARGAAPRRHVAKLSRREDVRRSAAHRRVGERSVERTPLRGSRRSSPTRWWPNWHPQHRALQQPCARDAGFA